MDLPGSSSSGKTIDLPAIPESGQPRYRLVGSLGQGGMAVIHLATDTQLGRSVAVKQLRQELSHNTEARGRFFAEAEILAGLDHPGAIPVYEVGTLPEGQLFYSMKRVKGRTLSDLLAQRSDRDIRDRQDIIHFVDIFERVCQTMAAAHAQGVIHRDLKPENIMVDELGVVYVMDWGLAKRLHEEDGEEQKDSRRTRLGAVMGTPAYMAPEQAAGQALTADRQADVFSLGVMLFEILTGVNPFFGRDAGESMKGVMFHEPDEPKKQNPVVSRDLSAVCMKALEKDPFKRYRSAEELAADIRSFREFRAVSAIQPRLSDRLAKWSRRRPRLASTGATLIVVAVVAILGSLMFASFENALVARAYDAIEAETDRIGALEHKLKDLETRHDAAVSDSEKADLAQMLHAVEADLEAERAARLATAMAITGFTIFSPEDRARRIVRESLYEKVGQHLEAGDLQRARAQVELGLRFYEKRNIFAFSDEEHEGLRRKLEEIDARINAERGVAATD